MCGQGVLLLRQSEARLFLDNAPTRGQRALLWRGSLKAAVTVREEAKSTAGVTLPGRHALLSHPCRLPRQTNVVTPAAQSLPLSQSPLLRASVKTPAASVGAGNTELCSKEVQNCGEVQPGTVMVKPLLLPRFVVG